MAPTREQINAARANCGALVGFEKNPAALRGILELAGCRVRSVCAERFGARGFAAVALAEGAHLVIHTDHASASWCADLYATEAPHDAAVQIRAALIEWLGGDLCP